MRRLNQIFMNPKIVKVFFAAYNDIINLQKDFGLYVVGLVDLQIMCNWAPVSLDLRRNIGLAQVIDKTLSIKLDKGLRNSDYRVRPLPLLLEQYAANDVLHLPQLLKCLLEQPGKSAYQRLTEGAHYSSCIAESQYSKKDNEYIGVNALSSPKRILLFVRDLVAKKEDVAPCYLLSHGTIDKMLNFKTDKVSKFVRRFEKPEARVNQYLSTFALIHTEKDKNVVIESAREITGFPQGNKPYVLPHPSKVLSSLNFSSNRSLLPYQKK